MLHAHCTWHVHWYLGFAHAQWRVRLMLGHKWCIPGTSCADSRPCAAASHSTHGNEAAQLSELVKLAGARAAQIRPQLQAWELELHLVRSSPRRTAPTRAPAVRDIVSGTLDPFSSFLVEAAWGQGAFFVCSGANMVFCEHVCYLRILHNV